MLGCVSLPRDAGRENVRREEEQKPRGSSASATCPAAASRMDAMNKLDLRFPSPPGTSDGQTYRVATSEGILNRVAPTLTRCLQIGLGRGFGFPFGANW